MSKNIKSISFLEALLIFTTMIGLIGTSVIKFGLSPVSPIILTISLLIFWARIRHITWEDIHIGLEDGVKTGIVPIFIFLLIGALISSWIAAGIIPAMMITGFKLVNINFFIPSTFLVCAIIGTSIGSAFTTASTVGLALMGMGITLGFNPALVAGAIISGAVFGDKMSPLSDSTNLSAAIAGADLFKHIRNMMWTTLPALTISTLLFFWFGRNISTSGTTDTIEQLTVTLNQHFSIGWWSAMPLIFMLGCSLLKVPAIATLLSNIMISFTLFLIQKPQTKLSELASIIENGFVSQTGVKDLDILLSRGGLASMLGSISLIILTLALGGMLMHFGIIDALMKPLTTKLVGTASLVIATVIGGIMTNIMIGEQYLAIILPGKAIKPSFDKSNLDPVVLSRALEDSGAVLNALIPWGVTGVFMANTLGVATLSYLPFSFFNLLCPILSILSGVTGIGIKMKKQEFTPIDS